MNRKVKITLGIFASVILAALAGTGLYRHFIAGQVTDGPVMENPAGPMLELLGRRLF